MELMELKLLVELRGYKSGDTVLVSRAVRAGVSP
jgi:hypothetical protein